MLLFIRFINNKRSIQMKFQYISCYCLSLPPLPYFLNVFQFQYISCYCLSKNQQKNRLRIFNFNTSHVTVYRRAEPVLHRSYEFQYISCYCLSSTIVEPGIRTFISIHLMLLFILLFLPP